MGMVMLHLDQFQPFGRSALAAVAAGTDVGVSIDRDDRRLVFEQALQQRHRVAKRRVGACVLQVTDMRRQRGLVAAQQAHRVLQFTAERQHGRRFAKSRWQPQRCRCQPARAALHTRHAGDDAQHRVVYAIDDAAVVHQKRIGNAPQSVARVVVADALRLIDDVAAGEHHRRIELGHQQVVQRRVRQHEAQRVLPRRDRRCRPGCAVAGQQHDRCRRASQQPTFERRHAAIALNHRQVARHHRQGLGRPPLALAQPRHCRLTARIAGQVVAAEAFDGDDVPGPQPGHGLMQRVDRVDLALGRLGAQRWAAGWAGIRLGVEAPVLGVTVFAFAFGTHHEGGHAGARTVVGQCADDGKTRPAVGAVGKRVVPAPVARIAQFGQAGSAGGGVGAQLGAHAVGSAALDAETFALGQAAGGALDAVDAGQRRCLALQRVHEIVDVSRRAGDDDEHAAAVIAYRPKQAALAGQAVDGGPKADALHNAGDADALGACGRDGGGSDDHGVIAAVSRHQPATPHSLPRTAQRQ